MLDARHDEAHSGGGQLVGDYTFGHQALLPHQPGQQARGRLGVPTRLNNLVQYVTVLIDGASQPVFPARDCRSSHHNRARCTISI